MEGSGCSLNALNNSWLEYLSMADDWLLVLPQMSKKQKHTNKYFRTIDSDNLLKQNKQFY